ncbi:MAG: DUF2235 domain-containing protein [Chryseobacterium sp.]|jgi:hypothetical protein|uniref:T6SS phospholipase effector Tle1-like catalytic domain-containing protein n=1 Tax=Chryseobacterium sp. TaxID=1871047 RepID=UPI00281F7694|nr:DUF2235 domain-containing protein [Chryseobacterium sp.]MDR2237056.1 DUF2235 domain-containing protein [Chryseobacterium sp.]
MVITGDTRPIAGTSCTYALSSGGKKITPKEWRIEYGGKVLATSTSGSFKFNINLAGKTVRLAAVTLQNGKQTIYSTDLTILAERPKIVSVEWQDSNGKAIGKRKVGYLDKIKLSIKTSNIPKGDTLKISVYEDDTTGDRAMGTYTSSAVNERGYAFLYFNQLSLYQTKLNNSDWVDEGEHEYYVKIVYKNHIDQAEEKTQLVIENELKKHIDQPKPANNPVVVGKNEAPARTKKRAVNFTFGVFLDGTLNNMYNTELRKKAEGQKQSDTTGLNRMILAGAVYKEHGDAKDQESSYENDLSNPAILFKKYRENKGNKLFKVYTEGIGTNSAPSAQGVDLTAGDYEDDDVMQGPGFGMGSAGIKDRVRKCIRDVRQFITSNISPTNETVGTITFDVFGFSRGAAAARHFVHVVTQGAYKPKVTHGKEVIYARDMFGYTLDQSYAYKMMPAYGYLGQLLDEAKLMDEQMKVAIRFVGIYDTVPHYGLAQSNDIRQLGLDDVNKANYVVHMVAADEHRANFSLVNISSVAKTSPESCKKGGIELFYPGVHCDVGGAYEEGRPDNPKRIDATIFASSLEPLRSELIRQGWFKEGELTIIQDPFYRPTINNFRLEGNRKKISNQYSYIPLHIMADFCNKKGVPIDTTALLEFKNFKENWISGNVQFLEAIKDRLEDYSFKGGKPFVFVEPRVHVEPPIVYATNSPDASRYQMERKMREYEGQAKLNAEADKKNEWIKFLRNNYLHWNSRYGQKASEIPVQKDHPNIENGKRKRIIY